MNLQFSFQGIPLNQDEAVALYEEIYPESKGCLDLATCVGLNVDDARILFELAVVKKSQALASIAYKLGSSNSTSAPTQDPPAKKVHVELVKEDSSLNQLLDKLNSTSGRWAVGVAMLLTYGTQENSWCTLKQTAVHFVNTLRVPNKSVLFKGFEYDEKEDRYQPRVWVKGADDRKNTFHVSPVYLSLVEAFKWCEENGLLTKQRRLSEPGGDSARPYMKRVYYRYRITLKGLDFMKLWSNAENFILAYYYEN